MKKAYNKGDTMGGLIAKSDLFKTTLGWIVSLFHQAERRLWLFGMTHLFCAPIDNTISNMLAEINWRNVNIKYTSAYSFGHYRRDVM